MIHGSDEDKSISFEVQVLGQVERDVKVDFSGAGETEGVVKKLGPILRVDAVVVIQKFSRKCLPSLWVIVDPEIFLIFLIVPRTNEAIISNGLLKISCSCYIYK